MSVSGVGQKYGQNNVAIMKRVNSADSAEKTGIVREVSEAEEMESFKKEFYVELRRSQRMERLSIWLLTYRTRLLKI